MARILGNATQHESTFRLAGLCRLQISSDTPDRAKRTVFATLGKVKAMSNIFFRTHEALALGKKLQTMRPSKHFAGGFDFARKIQRLLDAMDPQLEYSGD